MTRVSAELRTVTSKPRVGEQDITDQSSHPIHLSLRQLTGRKQLEGNTSRLEENEVMEVL